VIGSRLQLIADITDVYYSLCVLSDTAHGSIGATEGALMVCDQLQKLKTKNRESVTQDYRLINLIIH